GQPARLLRDRARRLPRHARARGRVGEGRRRRRAARGRRLPPGGEAHGRRPRTRRLGPSGEGRAAAGGRRLVSALALLLALAAPALAADELRLPPVMRATFDNGLRVLVAEYHELPLVEFHLIVGAGAARRRRTSWPRSRTRAPSPTSASRASSTARTPTAVRSMAAARPCRSSGAATSPTSTRAGTGRTTRSSCWWATWPRPRRRSA